MAWRRGGRLTGLGFKAPHAAAGLGGVTLRTVSMLLLLVTTPLLGSLAIPESSAIPLVGPRYNMKEYIGGTGNDTFDCSLWPTGLGVGGICLYGVYSERSTYVSVEDDAGRQVGGVITVYRTTPGDEPVVFTFCKYLWFETPSRSNYIEVRLDAPGGEPHCAEGGFATHGYVYHRQ